MHTSSIGMGHGPQIRNHTFWRGSARNVEPRATPMLTAPPGRLWFHRVVCRESGALVPAGNLRKRPAGGSLGPGHRSAVSGGAFGRVNGQHDHQTEQGVLRARHLQHIGIRPAEQLLGRLHDRAPGPVGDPVLPLQKVALYLPIVAVQGKAGANRVNSFRIQPKHTPPA